MKKIMLSAMAMFIAVTMINAQETRPNEAGETRPAHPANSGMDTERAAQIQEVNGEYIETFRKDINVNDDQIGRIRILHTETVNSYNSIDPRYFQSNDVYQGRVREILTERDEKLRSILTPEQYSRYNTNRARFQIYDQRYFPDDLDTRRGMAPDMRRAAPDGRQKAPGQIIQQTPSETSPVPNPGMQSPGQ
jgi:hypothetical protein